MIKKFFIVSIYESFNIRMKVHTEIVNGVCPECEEYTMLVGITRRFYRCMTCGTDLEQHVNGKITYMPHITKNTLQSKVEEYFNGEKK